jgi:hypothetical protein
MAAHRLALPLALLATTCLAVPASAQTSETRPPLPIDEWLRGPDRQDFRWKVRVSRPRLTFQQRHLVHIRATVDADLVHRDVTPPDLHFFVKVSDDQGHWLPGENYNHFALSSTLDTEIAIQFDSGLYLRSGSYTVAVIAYDSVHHNRNIWQRPLVVRPPKDDPLPHLDRDLPPIEFLADVPADSRKLDSVSPPFRARPVPYVGPTDDQSWPLGHGREWLPISTDRPVQVDLILDFSGWADPEERRKPSAQAYRQAVGRLLQIGSVLSHLAPQRGCVRVTSLDMLRLRTILDRVAVADLDWDALQRSMTGLDQFTIDVNALEKRKDTANFFRRSLTQVASDSAGCDLGSQGALHVVLVAAAGRLQFPAGTRAERLQLESGCECLFYYLRPGELNPGYNFDDVEKMLKSLEVRRLTVSEPSKFRRALADIIDDVAAASSNRTGNRTRK